MAQVKASTIKEAIAKFEDAEKCKASESKHVKIYGQYPPIEKMDASISTLAPCEHLSISSNAIEKIANLNGLKHLKILSLARNSIKSLTGLESVADTLEELWISYNLIEKLKGISVLKKLKVLYIRNNNIKDNGEFNKLGDLPCLNELGFVGNPLGEGWMESGLEHYNNSVTKVLPKLKNLDGSVVLKDDEEEES